VISRFQAFAFKLNLCRYGTVRELFVMARENAPAILFMVGGGLYSC
jgi:hypothetical protein